jgi:hypothetical protein
MDSASYPNMMKRCGATRNGCLYSPKLLEKSSEKYFE